MHGQQNIKKLKYKPQNSNNMSLACYTVWNCPDVLKKGDTSLLLFRRNAGTKIFYRILSLYGPISLFTSCRVELFDSESWMYPPFLQRVVIVWSHLHGYGNTQNRRVPVLIHEMTLYDAVAVVQCAISAASNNRPIFFESLNSHRYFAHNLTPRLKNFP